MAADVSHAQIHAFVASVPRGFSDLLAREAVGFGATDVKDRGHTVGFTGTLEVAYRLCLESWVASRVLLEIARFDAVDEPAVYAALRALDWSAHVDPDATLACEWSGRHPAIVNTHFGTLRLKDAICDHLRERHGRRPDIAPHEPGVRVHAHAVGTRVTVSIDLSGEGLHRRGWRAETGEAPLRENIAAGILLRAGWPDVAAQGGAFVDPMCGAGTLVIEAARMAADIPANHGRRYFGCLRWRGHDAALWRRLVEAVANRATRGLEAAKARSIPILGRDTDARVLREAARNASYAGVAELVRFEQGDLESTVAPAASGLLVTNPPWGLRLGDLPAAAAIHRELGRVLREQFTGWQAAVLSGHPSLGLELGLRAARVHSIAIGALECRLLRLTIDAEAVRDLRPKSGLVIDSELARAPGAVMFANRLRKNDKQLAAWRRREGVGCYRLYDADMPEYAFAIDVYTAAGTDERWLLVQEYEAPKDIPEETLRRRRSEALAGLIEATGIPSDHVRLRTRRRHKRGEQYAKRDTRSEFHVVEEGGLKFRVNFDDYLDTGLFLDHRMTRSRLRELAAGGRFLNLFCYTGSVTVYAAAGGAASTTSVDLSATYLEWARENLLLNGLDESRHRRVQADVREWLHAARHESARFELIFCDPPTFSNSKRMEGVFDVQRDHIGLIEDCLALLAPGGVLWFSTNAQRFELDPALAARVRVADLTRSTLPPDFARQPRIHRLYAITAG